LLDRCRGFRDALAARGAKSGVLYVDLQNKAQAGSTIAAVVRGGRYDGLLTLGGASIAAPTLDALRRLHLLGKVEYATFDIGTAVLKAVENGSISFALDQQPYLQGYLPIVLLTQYRLLGVMPQRGKLIATGPAFVTKRNAARVLRLAELGVR
jgi:simple sugar transport system substrate-binding protein